MRYLSFLCEKTQFSRLPLQQASFTSSFYAINPNPSIHFHLSQQQQRRRRQQQQQQRQFATMADNNPLVHSVVILGSGPAGLTAALYSARAQLKPLVFHGNQPGGQLTTTTEIENYPGFVEGIDANLLLENMRNQAQRFGATFRYDTVKSVNFSSQPLSLFLSGGEEVRTQAVIVATGARPRLLEIPSEQLYWSKGVSSCATCDGFFFRGKDVAVIGGGDSAAEEALFLTRMCPNVYLIHRRDKLRASAIMANRVAANSKIKLLWNNQVDEILGDGNSVHSLRLKNTQNGEISHINVKGVFIAIGHIPNTDTFKGVLDQDENGYLLLKEPNTTRTNVEGVFVSGDCVDHVYRQAVTAAGTGCMAAIDVERWLQIQGNTGS